MQQINDYDMKKAQLVETLHDRELTWYIKYNTTHLNASLGKTKDVLTAEFMKLNSKVQCVIEIKEIKQRVIEFAWDIDQ